METMYKFQPEEIERDLRLIGETFCLGSRKAQSGRGKRLYQSRITDKGLDEDAQYIIEKAKRCYNNGLKGSVTFSRGQVFALKALVGYCIAL